MQEIVVLRVVVRLLLPFILMYALYIQFHGEVTPGGGFQAGIIFAAAFIVYSLVNDLASVQKIIPPIVARFIASLGVIIYTGVGVVSMLMGGSFLNYSVLNSIAADGQKFGIMMVEMGVGFVVFAVILLIFYSFGERSGDES